MHLPFFVCNSIASSRLCSQQGHPYMTYNIVIVIAIICENFIIVKISVYESSIKYHIVPNLTDISNYPDTISNFFYL